MKHANLPNRYWRVEGGSVDAEPDILSFSFGRSSEKFYISVEITNDGFIDGESVLLLKQVVKINYQTVDSCGRYQFRKFMLNMLGWNQYEFREVADEASNKTFDFQKFNEGDAIILSGWRLRKGSFPEGEYAINLSYPEGTYKDQIVIKSYVHDKAAITEQFREVLHWVSVSCYVIQNCIGFFNRLTSVFMAAFTRISVQMFGTHLFFETSILTLDSLEDYFRDYSALGKYLPSTAKDYHNLHQYHNDPVKDFKGVPMYLIGLHLVSMSWN